MSLELKATSHWRLLERYASLAHTRKMARLAEIPESVHGKPWDHAHYIRVFRVEAEQVFLDVALDGGVRISGVVRDVSGARADAHPWGTALVLEGPLRWVGTRTLAPTGLRKMVARWLPWLGAERALAYDQEWPQLTLILPCSQEKGSAPL